MHAGPMVRCGFDFTVYGCPFHTIEAEPVICLNCKQHYVVVYQEIPHGKRLQGFINGRAVGSVVWMPADPAQCDCGVLK